MSEGSKGSSLAFGQVGSGPGLGKTTYCHGMQEFMSRIGKVTVVNLDPPTRRAYQCSVDIAVITLPDVMENLKLGPNGVIYCMEYLEANFELQEKLAAFRGHYLFDCPGQVELYTHHHALKNVCSVGQWNFRLAAVHLVDSLCTDPGKSLVLCTSLSTMLHVELPTSTLSKMDLIEQYGKLAFMDYYTEVLDVFGDHLASDPFFRNYRRLNEKLVEVIEDYSLVSFVSLNVQDKESMRQVMQAVDKANGYSFGDQEHKLEALMSAAVGGFHFASTLAVQERYVQSQDKAVAEEVMDL
ncbi:LOW QUALITY PROTEIN: GPN-loop GTPase 2 [Pterocles gutturalis]